MRYTCSIPIDLSYNAVDSVVERASHIPISTHSLSLELLPKPYTSLLFLARCRSPELLRELTAWETARHRGDDSVAFSASCYEATVQRLEALEGLQVAALPCWLPKLLGFQRQGTVLGGWRQQEAEQQVERFLRKLPQGEKVLPYQKVGLH